MVNVFAAQTGELSLRSSKTPRKSQLMEDKQGKESRGDQRNLSREGNKNRYLAWDLRRLTTVGYYGSGFAQKSDFRKGEP